MLPGSGSNLSASQGQLIAFATAHQPPTIANSDKILVLDGGAIIERGTHKTLMAKRGFYANLVQQLDVEETG